MFDCFKKSVCVRVLCAALLVCSCVTASVRVYAADPVLAQTVTIPDTPVPMAAAVVLSVSPSGTATESNKSAVVDYSNTNDGYIMVQYTGGSRKVKLQLTGPNQVTYTYNLAAGAGWTAFPLTAGNGSYTVNVYELVSGEQYALALGKTISAKLSSGIAPYLRPSQYVNYNANSATVAQGVALSASAGSQIEIVQNVYNWVVDNISYDYGKASSVKSGYLPVVDTIMASRTGICFDYAAVMATMLRTQGIPTRLEVGYVTGGTYHAWISIYLNGTGWVNGAIYFDGQDWKLMDPTFASSGKGSASIESFIANNANYKKSYVY